MWGTKNREMGYWKGLCGCQILTKTSRKKEMEEHNHGREKGKDRAIYNMRTID